MLTGRVRVCVHLARPSACTGTRLPHPPAALAAQSELRLGYGVLRCVSTLRSGGASTRWSTATRKAASARRRSTNASAAGIARLLFECALLLRALVDELETENIRHLQLRMESRTGFIPTSARTSSTWTICRVTTSTRPSVMLAIYLTNS